MGEKQAKVGAALHALRRRSGTIAYRLSRYAVVGWRL